MTGPTEKAYVEARATLARKGCPPSYGDRVLDAAYPVIRADVIAEVKRAIETWEGDSMATKDHEADLVAHIERVLGGGS